jgi:hypothetical protein
VVHRTGSEKPGVLINLNYCKPAGFGSSSCGLHSCFDRINFFSFQLERRVNDYSSETLCGFRKDRIEILSELLRVIVMEPGLTKNLNFLKLPAVIGHHRESKVLLDNAIAIDFFKLV